MNKFKFPKKILAAFIFCIILNSLFMLPASAHVLKTDGSIGAVLHIDPNDAPIAGSQASFFFEFKDEKNLFKPTDCDCTFLIIENGKNILTQPLFANNSSPSLENASIFFTFPKEDVYQVEVIGNPLTKGDFQPFKLVWEVRVDQEVTPNGSAASSNKSFLQKYLVYIIVALGGIIFLGFYLRKGGEKKIKNEK